MERRIYTRREIVKGGAAALLGASLALPLATRTVPLATREAGALTRGVSVGVFVKGNGPLHGDFTELDAYINLAGGVQPKLVSVFSRWKPEGSTTYLHPHLDNLLLFHDTYPNSTMIWSWEPWGVTLQEIIGGAHDAYIDEVARRIRDVGKRVLIRFAHEMNGAWPWPWNNRPPEEYIAAWRHVVDRFRAQGATNAEWLWSPNIESFTAKPFSPWYPGDEYVDWTGLDAYNWGEIHNKWSEFNQLFQYSIGVLTTLSPRGIIIAETGCHSRGPNGTEDKGQWYTNMATTLKQNYPNLLGLVNTHTVSTIATPDAEWRVDMPITALDDWKALVADPQFKVPLGAVGSVGKSEPGDTTAPKVAAVTPSNRATRVSPSANVTATFSEAMKASTINATTFKLFRLNADGSKRRVAAAVSYSQTSKKAVLNPNNNLRLGATYKATITTGARDLAGNALDQNPTKTGNQGKTWKFTVKRA
ncbi:MAG: Ig-like domain-containing protein [Rubrobacter sp.]|nr:Ig-like domain-containing protein [Rubrobacter sp.]